MLTEEKFNAVSKDLEEVFKKHNVEIIIRSELSFKERENNPDNQ